MIICKENSFRLITKNAVYQIELRAGRVLHGGFVPLGREDVLARQLDENVFFHCRINLQIIPYFTSCIRLGLMLEHKHDSICLYGYYHFHQR